MAKSKSSPSKRKARIVVKDIEPDKSAEPKGGTQFNPKELTIDKPVPWRKG